MDLARTTIRIPLALKKQAHQLALEENTSLQELVNVGLRFLIEQKAKRKAKKIVFHSRNLGVALDNLTRDDFYADGLKRFDLLTQ